MCSGPSGPGYTAWGTILKNHPPDSDFWVIFDVIFDLFGTQKPQVSMKRRALGGSEGGPGGSIFTLIAIKIELKKGSWGVIFGRFLMILDPQNPFFVDFSSKPGQPPGEWKKASVIRLSKLG